MSIPRRSATPALDFIVCWVMTFWTGTDEHGQKVEQSAEARGMSPPSWPMRTRPSSRRIMGMFDLTNDEFIRTTDPDTSSRSRRWCSV